mgnify:CR=1 FL=1
MVDDSLIFADRSDVHNSVRFNTLGLRLWIIKFVIKKNYFITLIIKIDQILSSMMSTKIQMILKD